MDLLSEEHRKQIQSVVDDTVANFIRNLPEQLTRLLNQNVARILGMRNDFGKWEADPFNKEATIHTLLNDRVVKIAADIVKEQKWKPTSAQIDGIERSFMSHLNYELESQIRKVADSKAAEIAKRVEKELTVDVLMQPVTIKNLADPKYMGHLPKLRDVILDNVAKGNLDVKK